MSTDSFLFPPLPCGTLGSDLDLYAEGELRSRAASLRVQRHLARCEACQDWLWQYDDLTAAVLSSGAEDSCGAAQDPGLPGLSSARAGSIMDRVRDIGPLPPVSAWLASRLPARGPRRRSPPRAWTSIASRAAAILVLAGLLAAVFLPRDGSQVMVAGGMSDVASTAGRRRAGSGSMAEPLRWVADAPRALTGDVQPTHRELLRLYGFRDSARGPGLVHAPRPAGGLEWVVDAIAGRPRQKTRVYKFFLVPENAVGSGDLIEIDPLGWSDPGGSTVPGLVSSGRTATVYRVLVINGAGALDLVAPPPERQSLPGVLQPRTKHEVITIPASLRL